MTLNSQSCCSSICVLVVSAQYYLKETSGRSNYFSEQSAVCFRIGWGKRRQATWINDEPFNCIQNLYLVSQIQLNRWVSQMLPPLASCCELPGVLHMVLYVFEHKTLHLLIHAPYTRIVVFCHISNIQGFRTVKFVMIPPCFVKQNACQILLYNRKSVVITYELINVVRAAHC